MMHDDVVMRQVVCGDQGVIGYWYLLGGGNSCWRKSVRTGGASSMTKALQEETVWIIKWDSSIYIVTIMWAMTKTIINLWQAWYKAMFGGNEHEDTHSIMVV